MTEPTIQAATTILDASLTAMRPTIEGLEADALNWRPGDETNTIAVLVTHAMSSTPWWLSLAMGVELPVRDRPAEFLATTDRPEDLLAWFDERSAQCRSILDSEAPFDRAPVRVPPSGWSGPPGPFTAEWVLFFGLGHLQEHVAHAQLTKQLWSLSRAVIM
jgi:DinB superfamily